MKTRVSVAALLLATAILLGMTAGASNKNIVITHSYISGSSASTLVLDNEDPNASVRFLDNLVFGSPGMFRAGTYGANIAYCGNSGAAIVAGCHL